MDQAPKSVDEFMGQKHSTSLVRTPKKSTEQSGKPALEGSSQERARPVEIPKPTESEQKGTEKNCSTQLEVMQDEIRLQKQHRQKYLDFVKEKTNALTEKSVMPSKQKGDESNLDK